jgi:hypothetical protein
MRSDKIWYLLRESIPAELAGDLLGSIVNDIRDPLADRTPRATPPHLVPAISQTVETKDIDARTEVGEVHSTKLSANLFTILMGSHARSQEANTVLEPSAVRIKRMQDQTTIFTVIHRTPLY